MNVLLVYPSSAETFWSLNHALKFIGKKAANPPLGLITAGAMLPGGWARRLIDLNVEILNDEDLKWADMVFISAMLVQRQSALQVIERCRRLNIRVVVGGPLFSAEPQEFEMADHLVLDEAEITLPLFLADLAAGRPRRIYRAQGYCDVHDTPVPAWELIRMKNYACMSIQFSRGCPFNCDFCNVSSMFGDRMRIKTVEQVIAELDILYASGWRDKILFVDDNFIGNRRFLKTSLLPALIEWRRGKKGCGFLTEASINLADDRELLALMVEAGFISVFIGIETPDNSSLSESHKRQNLGRDLLASVREIQRAGLEVEAGFIVGFDSDGPSIFRRQIDFIQQSGIVTAMVGLLNAPPGTRLYRRLQSENRLSKAVTGNNVDGTTNIVPKMGLNTLTAGYRSIMEHIYDPRHFYRRMRVLLEVCGPPSVHLPLNLQGLGAIFRSSIRLGLLGDARFDYWRLLIWTVFHRPKLMAMAIRLAIRGYHYRKICEQYIL